jgi:hypothetical protein
VGENRAFNIINCAFERIYCEESNIGHTCAIGISKVKTTQELDEAYFRNNKK